jgi:hypothetical protein
LYKVIGKFKDETGNKVVIHLESCIPGTRQYMTVCTGMSQYVPYSVHGGTRNLKMVYTSTY